MTARSEIKAYFTLRGDDAFPDVVRELLGAEPSRVRLPPGHGEHSRRYCKVPWCAYESGLGVDVDLQTQVKALLDRFHPLAARIREFAVAHRTEVMIDAVVESYDGDTPALFLPPDLVKQMSDLGASFWVDLYLHEDKAPEKRHRVDVDRG